MVTRRHLPPTCLTITHHNPVIFDKPCSKHDTILLYVTKFVCSESTCEGGKFFNGTCYFITHVNDVSPELQNVFNGSSYFVLDLSDHIFLRQELRKLGWSNNSKANLGSLQKGAGNLRLLLRTCFLKQQGTGS